MSRYLILFTVILLTVLSYGCANPAANKPKASVANAAPETNPAKPAGAETLVISPDNSKVEFVAAKVTRSHNGSFKQFNGTIDLLGNSAEQSRVTIDIETASVVTDEDQLTGHLKTPDFFDVAKYPKATFVSTKIERSTTGGATHIVSGNFDLHGVKASFSFRARFKIARDNVSVIAGFGFIEKNLAIFYLVKSADLIRTGWLLKFTITVQRK